MNFDLNIENYKISELIDMFDLPTNFDNEIILIKEAKLRENILKNNEINKDIKEKTINFIVKAKNIILNKNQSIEDTPFEKKIEEIYNSSFKLKSSELEDNQEHMIQVRKDKPYLSSFPSEFFPGIINPLKKRTIKKNLNIDTRFRDNYYSTSSTNFNLTL
jgi:hypothetical protein